MSDEEVKARHQRPWGVLIENAMQIKGLSARKAADLAGLSDARWRQIMNGYASIGGGQVQPVEGPDDTLARMARVVGVTPDQLRKAGRPAAADLLLTLAGMQAESDWQNVGSALDRLIALRSQLDGIIEELSRSGDGQARSAPRSEVVSSDE